MKRWIQAAGVSGLQCYQKTYDAEYQPRPMQQLLIGPEALLIKRSLPLRDKAADLSLAGS